MVSPTECAEIVLRACHFLVHVIDRLSLKVRMVSGRGYMNFNGGLLEDVGFIL